MVGQCHCIIDIDNYLCGGSNFIFMLDIKEYFCPNVSCKHYGLCGEGNLLKSGTYLRKHSGERKQMFKCRVCGYRFSETQSTIFAGCHYSEQTIRSIIVCMSEGNGIDAGKQPENIGNKIFVGLTHC